MTDLIEVKAADLSGEALGWAVGKAEDLDRSAAFTSIRSVMASALRAGRQR